MKFINNLKAFFMRSKKYDYQKEQYRGTIKQYMKVRGLRTISLANYNAWKGNENINGVHSLKLDVQDGYVNIYSYGKPVNGRYLCGDVISDASADLYKNTFEQVQELIENEKAIPSSVKRNILVKVSR